jgi:hypothetical protein
VSSNDLLRYVCDCDNLYFIDQQGGDVPGRGGNLDQVDNVYEKLLAERGLKRQTLKGFDEDRVRLERASTFSWKEQINREIRGRGRGKGKKAQEEAEISK